MASPSPPDSPGPTNGHFATKRSLSFRWALVRFPARRPLLHDGGGQLHCVRSWEVPAKRSPTAMPELPSRLLLRGSGERGLYGVRSRKAHPINQRRVVHKLLERAVPGWHRIDGVQSMPRRILLRDHGPLGVLWPVRVGYLCVRWIYRLHPLRQRPVPSNWRRRLVYRLSRRVILCKSWSLGVQGVRCWQVLQRPRQKLH